MDTTADYTDNDTDGGSLLQVLTEQIKILELENLSEEDRCDCVRLLSQHLFRSIGSVTSIDLIQDTLGICLREYRHMNRLAVFLTKLLKSLEQTDHQINAAKLLRIQIDALLWIYLNLDAQQQPSAQQSILRVILRQLEQENTVIVLPLLQTFQKWQWLPSDREELWTMLIRLLPSLSNIGKALKIILSIDTSEDELEEVLETLRSSLKHDNDLMDLRTVETVMVPALSRHGHLSKTYFQSILKTHLHDNDSAFELLDISILIHLLVDPNCEAQVRSYLEELLLKGNLNLDGIKLYTTLATSGSDCEVKSKDALVSLAMVFISAPFRHATISNADQAEIQEFGMHVLQHLDKSYQEKFIRCLLRLDSTNPGKQMESARPMIRQLFLRIAGKTPKVLANFADYFSERYFRAATTPDASIAAILSNLVPPRKLLDMLPTCLYDYQINKVAKGLVLAGEMIEFKVLQKPETESVLNLALRILLPPSRQPVEPLVGTYGLDFLSVVKKRHKPIFGHVQMIMANTGLVQLRGQYKKREGVVVAFDRPPEATKSSAPKTAKPKREFIFCVHQYLQKRGPSASWEEEVRWVHKLVNYYLQEGRSRNWSPEPWLNASVELPTLGESGTHVEDFFSSYSIDFHSKNERSAEDMKDIVGDLMHSEDVEEKVSHLGLSLVLAIVFSMTVLSNAHEHYKEKTIKSGRRIQVLRLIKYQMLKTYSLRQKARVVLDVAASLQKSMEAERRQQARKGDNVFGDDDCLLQKQKGTKKGERGACVGDGRHADNQSANEEVATVVDTHASLKTTIGELTEVLGILFSDTAFVDPDILVTCLVDSDGAKGSTGTSSTKSASSKSVGTSSRSLRCCLLGHLCDLEEKTLESHSNSIRPAGRSSISAAGVQHCARMVWKLLQRSSGSPTKKPKTSNKSSRNRELLLYYLRALNCAISVDLRMQRRRIKSTKEIPEDHFIHLVASAMDTKNQSSVLPGQNRGVDSTHFVFDAILFQLVNAEDNVVAMQLMETLSIVALHGGKHLIGRAVDACWRMLHTVYSGFDSRGVDSPMYSFQYISACVDAGDIRGRNADLSKMMKKSLVKFAVSDKKEFSDHHWMCHAVLLLWSLLAHPLAGNHHEEALFSKLVDEIELYLNDGDVVNSASKKRTKKKKRKKSCYAPSVPCLNGHSLSAFFEIVQQLLIASTGRMAAGIVDRRPTKSRKWNPYQHLMDAFRQIGRLVQVYQDYAEFFPRRMQPIVLSNCHIVLDLTVQKFMHCIDWSNQNARHSEEDRESWQRDAGSLNLLQELLDEIVGGCVYKIISFCETTQSELETGRRSAAGSYLGKINSLLGSSRRCLGSLTGLAKPLSLSISPTAEAEGTTRQKEVVQDTTMRDRGFHCKDVVSLLTSPKKSDSVRKKGKEAAAPTGGSKKKRAKLKRSDSDDDESSDEEFGVLGGGWGGDETHDAESSVELQLETGVLGVGGLEP